MAYFRIENGSSEHVADPGRWRRASKIISSALAVLGVCVLVLFPQDVRSLTSQVVQYGPKVDVPVYPPNWGIIIPILSAALVFLLSIWICWYKKPNQNTNRFWTYFDAAAKYFEVVLIMVLEWSIGAVLWKILPKNRGSFIEPTLALLMFSLGLVWYLWNKEPKEQFHYRMLMGSTGSIFFAMIVLLFPLLQLDHPSSSSSLKNKNGFDKYLHLFPMGMDNLYLNVPEFKQSTNTENPPVLRG